MKSAYASSAADGDKKRSEGNEDTRRSSTVPGRAAVITWATTTQKPVPVMHTLIGKCPLWCHRRPVRVESAPTLVAARNLGRRAIGVEVEERYAEQAARRLSQGVLAVS